MANNPSIPRLILHRIPVLFIFISSFFNTSLTMRNRRENLEIIIGGGGCNDAYCAPAPEPEPECPPPPPPPPPPPAPKQSRPPPRSPRPAPFPQFENEALAVSYGVIQKFKQKVTNDPMGVTRTWKGRNVCGYRGFHCEPPPGLKEKRIAAVDFNGFKLANKDGKLGLSGFLDKFPDIAIFHANSNNFTDTVPSISHLRYLYELDLSNNKLNGEFPMTVLQIPILSFLDIRFNFFTGYVPSRVFQLKLDALFLNNNDFNQMFPEELGNTPAYYLTLANNKFTGPIPRSIGKASATLLEVLFLNNRLSGCLPYEIGFLNNTRVFDAGGNMITGPIPSSFGCLTKMELFNLARNQLYGEVPEVLCQLPKLANLSLSYNYFTQLGPICRRLVKKGVVDVRMNCIRDFSFQRSARDCAMFFAKPKFCPDPASFKISPCNKTLPLLHKAPVTPQKSTPTFSPSYAALAKHHHL